MWPFRTLPRVIFRGSNDLIYEERGRRLRMFYERLIGGQFDMAVQITDTHEWELEDGSRAPVTDDDRAMVRAFADRMLRHIRIDWT